MTEMSEEFQGGIFDDEPDEPVREKNGVQDDMEGFDDDPA